MLRKVTGGGRQGPRGTGRGRLGPSDSHVSPPREPFANWGPVARVQDSFPSPVEGERETREEIMLSASDQSKC